MSNKFETKEIINNPLMRQPKTGFTEEELSKVFFLFPELLVPTLISALPRKEEYQYIFDMTDKSQPKLIIPKILPLDSEEYTAAYKQFKTLERPGVQLKVLTLGVKSNGLILKNLKDYNIQTSPGGLFSIFYLTGSLINKRLCRLVREEINKMPKQEDQIQQKHIELISEEFQYQAAKRSEDGKENKPAPTIAENPQPLLNRLGFDSAQAKLNFIGKILKIYSIYLEGSSHTAWQEETTRLEEEITQNTLAGLFHQTPNKIEMRTLIQGKESDSKAVAGVYVPGKIDLHTPPHSDEDNEPDLEAKGLPRSRAFSFRYQPEELTTTSSKSKASNLTEGTEMGRFFIDRSSPLHQSRKPGGIPGSENTIPPKPAVTPSNGKK